MLSTPIVANLAIAAFGPLRGAWSDPLYRLVLWGLLIWLLFESIEAVLHWSRHPWVPRTAGLRGSLIRRALAGLNLLMAGTLAGLGLLMIFTALRSEHGGGLRTGAAGVGALSFAVTAAWMVLTKLWQREGAGPAAEPKRRSDP